MARPPRLPDATIITLIEELRTQQAVLTGTRLRDELARRYGHRGGVSRLYRLLYQAAQSPPTRPPDLPPTLPSNQKTDVAELQAELAAVLERAHLAEYREQAHQDRWANEIHSLREQVRGQRDAAHRMRVLEQDVLDRSRELASAHLRIAELEARLR